MRVVRAARWGRCWPRRCSPDSTPSSGRSPRRCRGPVCVLAGAGHRQDPGDHPPHRLRRAHAASSTPQRVLAVTFTARAAGELRGRLRALGVAGRAGADVPRRGAAAAELLLAARRRRRAAAHHRVARSGLVAEAARACRLSLGRTELRDVAAEVEWAKVTRSPPEDYAAPRPRRPAAARRPPTRDIARVYAAYEQLKRDRGAPRLRGHAAAHRRRRSRSTGTSPTSSATQYRHFVVDEYQDVNPLQQRLLDAWLGDRDDLCVVGDANQTIYSFTGASPVLPARLPRALPRREVVRLVRDYRSTPQVVRARQRRARRRREASRRRAARAGRPAAGRAASRRSTSTTTSSAEADGASPRGSATLLDEGVPAREIAVLYRINAQSEAYEEALADAGRPLRAARRASGSSSGPRSRRPCCCCAAPRAPREADGTALVRAVRRRAVRRRAQRPGRPTAAGAARERWESLAALAELAEDARRRRARAGLPRLRRRAGGARRRAARADRSRASRSRRCTPRRAWSGTRCSSSGSSRARCRSSTPRRRRRSRRSAGCSTSASRGPASTCRLSWALPRSPGGARHRRPSRFLDGLHRQDRRRTAARADRSRRRAAQGPQPCRVCGRPLTAAVERKLGRCEDCPSDFDEDCSSRIKDWRVATCRGAEDPRLRRVHRRDAPGDRRTRPESLEELARIPGVGESKLDKYGDAVLGLCGH